MKKSEIKVGVTYHNGKTGNRSYSSREVLEIGRIANEKFGWVYPDGLRYKQVIGRYAGEEGIISFSAFAQWAKGRVGEETDHA